MAAMRAAAQQRLPAAPPLPPSVPGSHPYHSQLVGVLGKIKTFKALQFII